jgi:hypothetical protein
MARAGEVRVVTQGTLLASWGACPEGDSGGDHYEDVVDIEVELGGGPDGSAMRCRRAGRGRSVCPRAGLPVPVGHLPELGPSLYRWMRVAVAGRRGFRVQPEDRAELGAVDADVADESKQFRILLE